MYIKYIYLENLDIFNNMNLYLYKEIEMSQIVNQIFNVKILSFKAT